MVIFKQSVLLPKGTNTHLLCRTVFIFFFFLLQPILSHDLFFDIVLFVNVDILPFQLGLHP